MAAAAFVTQDTRPRAATSWPGAPSACRSLTASASARFRCRARIVVGAALTGLISSAVASGGPVPATTSTAGLEAIAELITRGHYTQAEADCRHVLADVEATAGAHSLAAADALDLLVESLYRGAKPADPKPWLWQNAQSPFGNRRHPRQAPRLVGVSLTWGCRLRSTRPFACPRDYRTLACRARGNLRPAASGCRSKPMAPRGSLH